MTVNVCSRLEVVHTPHSLGAEEVKDQEAITDEAALIAVLNDGIGAIKHGVHQTSERLAVLLSNLTSEDQGVTAAAGVG